MATQAYWDWRNAGSPWRAARPIVELRAKIKAAIPGATIYDLGAESSHLAVDFPQDHAPFSFTAWPNPLPGYVVTAADYMHRPNGGIDCAALFQRWLADCKAGRRPWTKYLIWQATLYDVRNGWRPQANSDHFDHIHESFRTDWIDRGIGDYNPLGGSDDMLADERAALFHTRSIADSIITGRQGPDNVHTANQMKALELLRAIAARVDIDAEELKRIEAAAEAGAVRALATGADAIVAKIVDRLPAEWQEDQRAAVKAAVREVFADAGTPDAA